VIAACHLGAARHHAATDRSSGKQKRDPIHPLVVSPLDENYISLSKLSLENFGCVEDVISGFDDAASWHAGGDGTGGKWEAQPFSADQNHL
jgi:hypothetical protein